MVENQELNWLHHMVENLNKLIQIVKDRMPPSIRKTYAEYKEDPEKYLEDNLPTQRTPQLNLTTTIDTNMSDLENLQEEIAQSQSIRKRPFE